MRLKLNSLSCAAGQRYGMIRWKQAMGGSRHGTLSGDRTRRAHAKAYGAKGSRVDSTGRLGACARSRSSPGVRASGVDADRPENERVLVNELRNRRASGADLD